MEKNLERFLREDFMQNLSEGWYTVKPHPEMEGSHIVTSINNKANPYKHTVGDVVSKGEHSSRQYAQDGGAYSSAPAPAAKKPAAKKSKTVTEANYTNKQIADMANKADAALDKTYGYGRVKGGVSPIPGRNREKGFGAAANFNSAKEALVAAGRARGNVRTVSNAVHKGWGKTVDQMPAPESKQSAREKLRDTPYFKLSRDEQEKDDVISRTVMKARKKK